MATLAQQPFAPAPAPAPAIGDERFFLRGAILMTITAVGGFGFAYLMGRSTFEAPLRVQFHAWVFMGWVGIYLLQNIFATTGRIHLHRLLGRVAVAWLVPMIVMGLVVTVTMVRAGHVPFVFRPLQFLVFDPVTMFVFVGLIVAGVLMRRRTAWHRRLNFCGMSMLLMPPIARLLPLPLLMPWGWEAAFAASLLFPLAGAIADVRRSGRVHPAWEWGVAAMLGGFVLVEAITYSAAGTALYRTVTAGSAGAAIAPLDFAPPPAGPLLTGRP
jgi:hypothetical protein